MVFRMTVEPERFIGKLIQQGLMEFFPHRQKMGGILLKITLGNLTGHSQPHDLEYIFGPGSAAGFLIVTSCSISYSVPCPISDQLFHKHTNIDVGNVLLHQRPISQLW